MENLAQYTDRDLSWLDFNERILLEAERPELPLMERLKFIAIFSSNLEEFYKVRVASHRFAQKYRGDKKNKFGYRPSYVLQEIHRRVSEQQERVGQLFFSKLLPAFGDAGVTLLRDQLTESEQALAKQYFAAHLKDQIEVQEVTSETHLELKNQAVYLYAVVENRQLLLELDYEQFGRFITLSKEDDQIKIIQLDDMIRQNSVEILSKFNLNAAEITWSAVKISRDAELYVEEEDEEDMVKRIRKSIRKRDTGMPSRLLFDESIAFKDINNLRKKIEVDMSGLVPGGRYHNFYDFFGFPVPKEKASLFQPSRTKVPCVALDEKEDWFAAVREQEVFLSFPYQDYDYVTQFLQKAAEDPLVEEINITLYRVASTSAICQSLERAAKQGKKVFVLSEVQARFDEESNIYWGHRLEEAGAVVKYGVKDLKVHAKIFTIKRREAGSVQTYAYLGTGNFNEKTANIYADHALMTTNEAMVHDLEEVFTFLKDESYAPDLKTLWVAPFSLRTNCEQQLKRAKAAAEQGKQAHVQVKLNSLEDPKMIDAIRKAADAGVKIDLLIRGLSCYHAQSDAQANNITVVGLIDQYLEHTRIYHFNIDGEESTYLASADWMTRNLSKRVEVAFPVMHPDHQKLLLQEVQVQLDDHEKGRYLEGPKKHQSIDGAGGNAQDRLLQIVNEMNIAHAV